LPDTQETLMGELVVYAKLAMGSENVRLLFTDRRMIFDHMGKRGAGAIPGTNILGGLSNALENLFKTGRESGSKKHSQKMTPGQLLASHKDNFAVGYDQVISVSLTQTQTLPAVTLLTTDDKYEFQCRERFDKIVELFKAKLADRLTIRRLA
jgi:hypothetical protein